MKEKEITIYDLAHQLNLSPATISRGLKNDPTVQPKTRKKISDLANEMGYRSNNFASNLRSKQTNTIGVIVPRLDSSFMSSVLAGIEHIVNKEGFNLIISQSMELAEKEALNARTMFNNRVDALLVSLAYDTVDIKHFEPFFTRKIPLLFFDRIAFHKHSTSISIDNRKAAYEITSHLIAQRCKRIMHITAPSACNVYMDRISGYKMALAEHGIAFKEEYLVYDSLNGTGGANVAHKLLAMTDRPDGVFAANDSCAVGCMQVLMKAGVNIPGDIAFAGFNNDPVSTVVQPNLTTVDYPGYKMGEIAAQTLVGHLKGRTTLELTNQIILHSELIIRESSMRTTTV